MSTLELRNLTKVFADGTVAVRNVDLTIADGEFLAIVGPSGCGKTTVLRMVAGLEPMSAGEVIIDGECVNDHTPQQRDIAMAFQQHALYPHMTVAENIGFSLRMAGWHKRDVRRRVAEVAAALGLSNVLDLSPRRLSGGQQQRVSMGRAIIRNPRLFLMDEPMSHLDAKLRASSRVEILKIQRRLSATTMYVTHDQVEAMSMADRVVVMREGSIVQIGSPLELYRRPVDVFVAQFMGSPPMSIVAGRVRSGSCCPELMIGPYRVSLPSTGFDLLVDRRVAVGLRPEAFRRSPDGAILASVAFAEHLGAEQLVHATIDCPGIDSVGDETVNESALRASISLYLPAEENVSLWEPLRLGIDVSELHFFDLETGLRLDTNSVDGASLRQGRPGGAAAISTNHAGSRVGLPSVVAQPCTVTPVA